MKAQRKVNKEGYWLMGYVGNEQAGTLIRVWKKSSSSEYRNGKKKQFFGIEELSEGCSSCGTHRWHSFVVVCGLEVRYYYLGPLTIKMRGSNEVTNEECTI